MKKSIFFALLSLCFITKINAQLKFRNSESVPINVAIAYYIKTEEFEGWYTIGWYNIEPNETKVLIAGDLEYTTYYYYAKDDKGLEWKGGGKYNFVVDYDAFNIKNADKSYQLKGDRAFKPFKKIEVGEKRTYTLSLVEEED